MDGIRGGGRFVQDPVGARLGKSSTVAMSRSMASRMDRQAVTTSI
jgi:hypothetical protein